MTHLTIHTEVFIVSRLLAQQEETFTKNDLREEIERRFGDTRPGVDTHISSHCVANVRESAAHVYCYLWREGRGLYRVFDPDRDTPHPTRTDCTCMPEEGDIPEEYRYLVRGWR
jgi:hypothetical protein